MKTRKIYCIICGTLLNPNDMDYEWCNNCLRKHLDKTDPHTKPKEDKELINKRPHEQRNN